MEGCEYEGGNLKRHLQRRHPERIAAADIPELLVRLDKRNDRGPRRGAGRRFNGLPMKECTEPGCKFVTHLLRKHLKRGHRIRDDAVLDRKVQSAKVYRAPRLIFGLPLDLSAAGGEQRSRRDGSKDGGSRDDDGGGGGGEGRSRRSLSGSSSHSSSDESIVIRGSVTSKKRRRLTTMIFDESSDEEDEEKEEGDGQSQQSQQSRESQKSRESQDGGETESSDESQESRQSDGGTESDGEEEGDGSESRGEGRPSRQRRRSQDAALGRRERERRRGKKSPSPRRSRRTKRGAARASNSEEFFSFIGPETPRHEWLTLFHRHLGSPFGGNLDPKSCRQHAAQVRTILEHVDPDGDDVACLSGDEGNAVWTKWVEEQLFEKASGTIKAYLCSLEKFLECALLERVRERVPRLHPDTVAIFKKMQKAMPNWRSSVTKICRGEDNEKSVEECLLRLTDEDVEAFLKSPVMTRASALLREVASSNEPSVVAGELSRDSCLLVRDYLICKLVAKCGTRPGALENLKLKHFDRVQTSRDGGRVVLVNEHKTKKCGPAIVAFDAETNSELRTYVDRVRPRFADQSQDSTSTSGGSSKMPKDRVFLNSSGRPFEPGTLGRRVTALWEKSRVRPDVRVSVTMWRKSIVTSCHRFLGQNDGEDASTSANKSTVEARETALRKVMSHSNRTAERDYLREDPAVLGETACRVIEAARRRALETAAGVEKTKETLPRERAGETVDDEHAQNADTERAKDETEMGEKAQEEASTSKAAEAAMPSSPKRGTAGASEDEKEDEESDGDGDGDESSVEEAKENKTDEADGSSRSSSDESVSDWSPDVSEAEEEEDEEEGAEDDDDAEAEETESDDLPGAEARGKTADGHRRSTRPGFDGGASRSPSFVSFGAVRPRKKKRERRGWKPEDTATVWSHFQKYDKCPEKYKIERAFELKAKLRRFLKSRGERSCYEKVKNLFKKHRAKQQTAPRCNGRDRQGSSR